MASPIPGKVNIRRRHQYPAVLFFSRNDALERVLARSRFSTFRAISIFLHDEQKKFPFKVTKPAGHWSFIR
jgi:hypothetical protein